MPLNKDMIITLRRSWNKAEPVASTLLHRFYETLFEMEPSVAKMFSGIDMAAQQNKLGAALGLVIREVENPGKLLPALEALGRRHGEIGVTPDQYDIVGAALLSALDDTLGDDFTNQTREAWSTAYATVAGAMIAAAEHPTLQSA